jgi:hypothetical protein
MSFVKSKLQSYLIYVEDSMIREDIDKRFQFLNFKLEKSVTNDDLFIHR